MMRKKVCIFGAGGLGRSVYSLMRMLGEHELLFAFVEDDDCFVSRTIMDIRVLPLSAIQLQDFEFLLAIGSPTARQAVANRLGSNVRYASCIHPSVICLEEVIIESGAIIFPSIYLSRNICIGHHAIIMPGTVIGHDVVIGDCFTASANVSIGGHARIGNQVFCGLSSCIKDKISLTDGVVVGMGAVVARTIENSGTYFGNPARRLTSN